MKSWVRSSHAHLVEVEEDLALFFFFGNQLYVEREGLQRFLPALWDALEQPVRLHELAGRANFPSEEVLAKIFSHLEELRLISSWEAEAPAPEPARSEAETRLREFLLSVQFRQQQWHRLPEGFDAELAARVSSALEARLLVLEVGGQGRGAMERALREIGFRDVRTLEIGTAADVAMLSRESAPTMALVWGAWSRKQLMARVNGALLAAAWPWLYVLEDGFGGSLGPARRSPLGAPCFHCLFLRRNAGLRDARVNLSFEKYLEEGAHAGAPVLPHFRAQLAAAAAFEAAKILTRATQPFVLRGVCEFDFLNHRTEHHEVLPVPNCPSCAPTRARPPLMMGLDAP